MNVVTNKGGTASPSPFSGRGIFCFNMLPDYLAPNLKIVFVGINPGEYSNRVGHYFARSTNSFWPALFESGLLPERLTPHEDYRINEFGYGLTDIVKRSTPNASYVARDEFAEGARVLRAKLEPLAPKIICFVGLVGYRQGFDPHAQLGEQPERWRISRLYIVPSTSPRNARYRPEVVTWFARLKNLLDQGNRLKSGVNG